MRKISCLFSCFSFIALSLFSQDFSNKGKDFWVGYGYHQVMVGTGPNGNGQQMVLYFATDQVTNVTVSIPGSGYTQTYTNIPANTIFTSNPLPKTGIQDARLLTETFGPQDKGIHIVSDKPIVAYAHIYNMSVSGASILFPTPTLGREYYSINYTNNSNIGNSNCWFYVIACDTGTTTVEIIPTGNTLTRAAGVPFTVTLTQGQIYNVMGQYAGSSGVDLTGSRVRSIATASGTCKRIAVFSGSGRISITCTGGSSSSDNYMVQSFPKNAWGKKYLTVPTGGSLPNTIFRICVSNPSTAVTLNGLPIPFPLVNNFYYEIPATPLPQKIESDLPITVAQYFTSERACGNDAPGDPEVIYLSPVEQNISDVLWNATPNFNILSHYYGVVIPNTGTAISSFKIDGVSVSPSLFIPHPQDPGYSYLVQNVGPGQRRIQSDSGFNAVAYGFGAAESYGYNAGTNIKDLFQKVGVSSQYGIENTPSVCTGSPFKFKLSLPYLADSIRWNLTNLPGSPANVLVDYSDPPVPADTDSTTSVSGKTIYWYSLPSFYTFNSAGVFPVIITIYAPNAEGCGNEQTIDFDLQISNPPVAAFTWVSSGCTGPSVQFNDMTTTSKPTYKWYWHFGDPASGAANFSTLQNPVHSFSGPGSYIVRFANITTAGCVSDTFQNTVLISPLPTAQLSGSVSVCANAPQPLVTFTGLVGTAPFTFNYNINNGPNLTVTTIAGNSVGVPVPTTTIGSYSYHLVSVRDAGGTAGCFQNQRDTVVVNVNDLPVASISGSTGICQNGPSPVINFMGSGGGGAPFTFTYKINGGPNQFVTTTAGNSVSVPVSTATAGTFIYTLVNVIDASATACGQAQSGTATVVVNPLPTATISGTNEVCLNGTNPAVIFTGAGGTAPYTFTYTINGGTVQTATSTGNAASLSVSTVAAGVYVYQLISVRDASSTVCSRLQGGTATVTVHPIPTANFNITTAGCVGRIVGFQDISVANAGVINSWSWNFNDPSSGAANTSTLQNPVHVFSALGNYNVTLVVTNDKGCTSTLFMKPISIRALPNAGFISPEVCLLDPFALLTDTSSVDAPENITGWLWNFGDPGSGAANTSTAQNGQHTYSAVGNYPVVLIVSTRNGCTDTLSQNLTINGGNPQAVFVQLGAASACSSDSISIQNKSTIASGSITKVEIYWDNASQPTVFEVDDVPVFNKIYKHKYPTSTTMQNYNVRFRAYSGGVCVNERIQSVTVLATPDVSMASIPNQCYSTTPLVLSFGAQTGTVAGTGSYSGPGVSFVGGTWQFLPSAAGIGQHSIQYKFTATAGGCADSTSTSIVVLDTASARFAPVAPFCELNSISFNDLSTAPAGVTLQNTVWNFGDGSALETHPAGQTVTHAYSAPNNYTVTIYNSTSAGCNSAPYSRAVSIKPTPLANFSFPDTLCLPAATVSFKNLSSISDGTQNSFTYQWNFGDAASPGNTSTAAQPTHVYGTMGPYNVKLIVTSGAGCIGDTTITLNSIHPQPRSSFSISRPGGICIGDPVSFTDASTGLDGSVDQWRWNFDDGTLSQLQNPSHLYGQAKAYNVSLHVINSFGCRSDTTTTPFTVNPYPVVNAGPDAFVLEGGSIVLNPTVTATQPQFVWTPATYLSNANIERPTSKPLQDITYTLTVTGRGGCTDSNSVFIKILLGPKIPNTFSPNGDGINEKWLIDYLDTYPNNRVQVFTRAGQLVFESRGYKFPWNGTMNGKTLPVDTYYYIIEPENGRKPITGFVTILK